MRGAAATRTVAIRTVKFLLTRLMRGAARDADAEVAAAPFLLTRLMRGAAKRRVPVYEKSSNFYSRASCEARL